MARGTQLLQIVSRLRSELGRATDVNVGVGDVDQLKSTIRRVYETLHEDYDWPHLRTEFPKIPLVAGQRYYDLPTFPGQPSNLDYDRIESVVNWYSGLPHPMIRGISLIDYSFFDSTIGVTSSPALKWDIRFTGTKEQVEIWPIPADPGATIQFTGFPRPKLLVNDSDTLDIDDILVLEFAAAQILSRQKSEDAQVMLQQAQQRYSRLKGRAQGASKRTRLGMEQVSDLKNYRAVVRVR